ALLCHDRQTDLTGRVTACNACAACKLIPRDSETDADEATGSAHPDLHIITKELARYSDDAATRNRKLTQIPVDVLRTHLLEPVQRGARMRHGKVFIVDEAEMLNAAGQNLLLKTLEEPPAGTTIILITASEDRLLPTIRSRCHRIAFVPLPDETVQQWLHEHAPDLIERDRQWLIEFAGGSLGRAQLAIDYNLTEWAETVIPALERIVQGQPSGALGQQIAERIDTFAKEWVNAHANASKEAANKLAADLMGALLAARARRRVRELADQCEPGDPWSHEAALAPWLGVIDAVERMRELLASNVNLSLACDHLVAQMSNVRGANVG
ncbi:MAG: ATP-binding protein, partial [Phycisphaeraceae bacterium]